MSETKSSRQAQSMKEAKRQLKCGICSETFKDPRLLSCLHSFCFHCIRRYVEKDQKEKGKKSSFSCPLCIRKMDLPKGGVKNLRPNFYVVAQTTVDKTPMCDICDVGNKAMEKCLDCDENLCANCLALHHKMKATRSHRTSTIGDAISQKTGVPVQKIQQKQYCPIHEAEEMRFFCVPCAKIVCRDCKTLDHTVHQTLEIGEVAAQRKKEINKSMKHTKDFLPKMIVHIKSLESMMKSLAKNTQNTTEAIKKQTQALHDEIDRIAKEMVQEIKQKNKEMEATLQKNIKAAELAHASMDSIILAAESFISVGSDHDIIETAGNIKARIEALPKEVPNDAVDFLEFKFNPGTIPSMDLWSCFGTWSSEVATTVSITVPQHMRPAMALITRKLWSFTVQNKNAIISIAPNNEGDAWICNSLSNNIYKYDKTGKCKLAIKAGSDIGDLFVASDGSLLMSFPREKKIKRMTSNNIITDYANTPLFPAGLTQTDGGDILVCGMDKLDEKIKGTQSKGSVLRVNPFGRCEKLEKESQNSVFSKPIRIAINANNDICVSDWMKGKDHVIALTPDGKTKWKYFGPKTITLSDTFVPNAVACDKYCQLLIADSHNSAIHLVDKDGRFVKLLLTEKDGLGEPWSVAVDSDGFLWVGDTEGQVQIYKYMS